MEPQIEKHWLSILLGLKSDCKMIKELVRQSIKDEVDVTLSIQTTDEGLTLTVKEHGETVKVTSITP